MSIKKGNIDQSISFAMGSFGAFFLFLFSPALLQGKGGEIDFPLRAILSNSSIVQTREIKIEGYPNAYNPSLIEYKNGYLLSFRFASRYPEKWKNDLRQDVSLIGIVKLDENFKVFQKTVQLLNVSSHSPQFSLTAEDARLFEFKNRLFIFFNDLPFSKQFGKVSMYFGELGEEKGYFVLKERAKPLIYLHSLEMEKNWTPFTDGEKIYLIYSDEPRVILELDPDTGFCTEISRDHLNWNWRWGEIRGGTPASRAADGRWVTFFHSSFPANTRKGKIYVMGAYIFEKEFPFSICAMTPFPLGDITDYSENNGAKVVFPGGIAIRDGSIHVAWGKGDKQIWITTFDQTKLFDPMRIDSSLERDDPNDRK